MEIDLGNDDFIGIYKKDINIFFDFFKDNSYFKQSCEKSRDKILELEEQANKIKIEFSKLIQISKTELKNDNKNDNFSKIKSSLGKYNESRKGYFNKLKENDLFKKWEENCKNINEFILNLFWENEDPDISQKCLNNYYKNFITLIEKETKNIEELNSIIVFLIYFQFKYFNEFKSQESIKYLKNHCDIYYEIEKINSDKINLIISILYSIESAITNQIERLENSTTHAIKACPKVFIAQIKSKIKSKNHENSENVLTKNKIFAEKLTKILDPFFIVTFTNGFYEIEKKEKYLPENLIKISINELILDINKVFIRISNNRRNTISSRINAASDYLNPQIALAQNYMSKNILDNKAKGSHMEMYLCNELNKIEFFDLKLQKGFATENYYYEVKLKSQKIKLNPNDIHFIYSSDKELVNYFINKFGPIFNNLLQKNIVKLISKRKNDIQNLQVNISNKGNNSFQNFLNSTILLYKNYFSIKEEKYLNKKTSHGFLFFNDFKQLIGEGPKLRADKITYIREMVKNLESNKNLMHNDMYNIVQKAYKNIEISAKRHKLINMESLFKTTLNHHLLENLENINKFKSKTN